MVYAAADSAPNAATVKAQGTALAKGTSTALASANTASVTGLTGTTAYKAYVIVEDAANNQSAVSSISFTTLDATAPTLSAESASGISGVGATLNFTSNEAGNYYYVVYAAADSAPDAATVKAQGTALAKGTAAALASANTASVTGLTETTAYKAYVIVEDSSGNKSAVSPISFTTLDVTAPTLSAESTSGISDVGATLNFTSNEAGTYYYVVYASADSAPNAATVKAQGTALAKGTSTALASANTVSLSGLTATTAYKAYVVVTDAANNDSIVSTLAFSTTATPDTTAPTVTGQGATSITHTTGTLNFTSNEAGTYYYVVYPSADPAPNGATVKAQGAAVAKGQAPASASANTINVTALTASTAYKAYVIVEDSSNNISAVVTIALTTTAAPDTTAPTLSSESASGLSATGGTLNFTSNEVGTYYYVVYAAADSAPNAATVKAQGVAVAKGTAAALASANTISISGLSGSTAYKAYVVVEDSSNNASAVSTIVFTTTATADTTAPIISSESASGISSTGATLNFTSSETGTYYYVVYPSGDLAPNGATVKAQGPAVAKGTGSANASNNTANFSGLSALTDYKAYVVVEDAASNMSAVSTITFVTTGSAITLPSAPTAVSATAGDQSAVVTFIAPTYDGGTPILSYKATSYPENITAYGLGTSNTINVTGLTNGVTYFFTVEAINGVGSSPMSAASNSVIPGGNSGLSTLTASFDKKTSAQADITLSMNLNGNVLTNIKNGTVTLVPNTNYFTSGSAVTISKTYLASLAVGTVNLTFDFSNGLDPVLAITVSDTTPTGGGGGGGDDDKPKTGGGGSGTGTSPGTGTVVVTPVSTPPVTPSKPTATVIVNGEDQSAGTSVNGVENGQTTTVVTVDTTKLDSVLAVKGDHATVTIPISSDSDVAIAGFTGQMVKNMETKDATVVVQTDTATYTLLASEINIDAVSKQLGQNLKLSDIQVQIRIAEPSASSVKVVGDSAKKGDFTIMVPAVDFSIECIFGGKTVNVDSFNSYVERTVAIPQGVDPNKITTGVVVNPDGSVHHVPTQVIQVNGKYFAKINSRTNSVYTVIWNPITFTDVNNHWAKDSVNNMGSRKVVNGVGNGNYNPNKDITRGEFAAIIVRALGLQASTGESTFKDIKNTDWYYGYIVTASKYGIINGYNAAKFAPNDKITREQAMTMISRAMKMTGLEAAMSDAEMSALLASYKDGGKIEAFAKVAIACCLKTEVVSGTSQKTLAPKHNITRAEVAVIIERLLKKSKLI